ncbi:hypothetical protein CC86DRAFT_411262 [Ophiobolus disseminans]|uniref:Uncharacterized protein n=1 Tax=Ophiobolus disseminans TaxID=1469910 RepID=A0A6A6ZKF9_9PLEO|nr:hypothetical protein CC86DRAFT_411262 [Ophiobolus disseminans]
MSKRDFYPMFMAAWETLLKKETILKAFEATGLSPLNPEVILKRFNQPAQSGYSSDSDSSALSASDWRKTERLLRQVAEQDYHGGAKFWSLRKVKEARDCQLQQGLEEEQLQHQRAEAACLREVKKQEKLQAAQKKRAARAAAQIIRQEEKARKAAD